MTRTNHAKFMGASAIWLATAGIATADITAAEVWDSWKSYAESIGQTITVGSESGSGDTMTLQDVNIAMEFPEGRMSGTLQLLELKERGDGTVAITLSEDYPMAISINPADGEEIDMGIVIRQTGMSTIASGGDGTVAYDYTAAQVSVNVDKLFVGGQDFAPRIGFALSNIDGNYKTIEGDLRQIESAMTADTMTFDVNFVDPTNGGTVAMNGSVDGISSESSATMPMEIDTEDPSWVFGDDFSATGGFSSGQAGYTGAINNGSDSLNFEGGSASNSLTFAFDDGGIGYGGTSTETEYRISGSAIPLPQLVIGMAETAFDLRMPMKQTDAPTDFGLLTKIAGFYVSEDIWNMFDPGQVLPRDPATAIIDITGKIRWLIDLGNTEEIAESQSEMPVELHAVTVNDVTLAVAGASVEGQGDFTFDPSDLVTFNGMPAPTGAIDFKIVGANGLIDKLIQLGFLPQDQAMGARMMLGMFARPGDGVDTLTSRIEVNGDGSVLANGQRIK